MMGNALSKYTDSRNNNFNLIRFIAASFVLYSHSYPLALGRGAAEPLGNIIGMSLGGLAVDVFFLTSGFLVASSFFTRNNIIAFVWARVLRIYPALIIAVIFCVFIVGLYFTTNSISEYFSDSNTYKYFKRNVTLFWGIKYHLPGVFSENPYKGAVNGSLWTLPYEVKMYTYLAIIAFLLFYIQKKLDKILVNIGFLIIAIASIIISILNHFYLFASIHFVHLFSMFFVGTSFYLYRKNIYLSHRLFFVVFILLLFTMINKDYFFIAYVFILPYTVFYLAYVPSGSIRNFNKLGDYSYGIYIYAFPVQQSIAAIIPDVTVTTMVILSFGVTLFLSILSWHLVEKKFLTMKDRYIFFENIFRNTRLKIACICQK